MIQIIIMQAEITCTVRIINMYLNWLTSRCALLEISTKTYMENNENLISMLTDGNNLPYISIKAYTNIH